MQNQHDEAPRGGKLFRDVRAVLFVVGSVVALVNMVSLVVGFFAGARWAQMRGNLGARHTAGTVETTGLPVEDEELEEAAEAWDRDSGAV